MRTNKRKKTLAILPASETVYAHAPAITVRWSSATKWFIAIHRGGYGVDTDPAAAILAAQESVAIKDKPTQLALYVSDVEMEPTGFINWPNGNTPRLVGLTNTHQGWIRRDK